MDPGGSTNPDSGIDNSIANYISAYSGNSITIAFDANQKYFGLLWGSPDVSNTISLYEGATLLATYTGAGLEGNAVGLEPYPAAGSFVDFVADNAGTYFDKVVISENASYFEIDNLASLAAPEPAAWALLMLGVGMVGFSLRTTRDRRAGVA